MIMKNIMKASYFMVGAVVATFFTLHAEDDDGFFLHDTEFTEKVLPLVSDEAFEGEHYLASDFGIYTMSYWLGREEGNDNVKFYRPSTLFDSNSEFWSWIASKYLEKMKTDFVHSLLESGVIDPNNLDEKLEVELKIPTTDAYVYKFKLPNNDSFFFAIKHDATEDVPECLQPAMPLDEVFKETASWVLKNITFEANSRLESLNREKMSASTREIMHMIYI